MNIPNIEQINGEWTGKIELESWNQFFEKKLELDLNVGGDMEIIDINVSHEKAYEYLMKHQEEILGEILAELYKIYPQWQEEYGYDDEELEEYMPDLEDIDSLKKLMTPERVYVMNVEKDDIAYVGFHFTCLWDDEHDFGVMTHKQNIIKMGGADMAFLSWIAKEDKDNMNSSK